MPLIFKGSMPNSVENDQAWSFCEVARVLAMAGLILNISPNTRPPKNMVLECVTLVRCDISGMMSGSDYKVFNQAVIVADCVE
jgi:hypothetical protein